MRHFVAPHLMRIASATRFELAINRRASKVTGLEVPTAILRRPDEVIEQIARPSDRRMRGSNCARSLTKT